MFQLFARKSGQHIFSKDVIEALKGFFSGSAYSDRFNGSRVDQRHVPIDQRCLGIRGWFQAGHKSRYTDKTFKQTGKWQGNHLKKLWDERSHGANWQFYRVKGLILDCFQINFIYLYGWLFMSGCKFTEHIASKKAVGISHFSSFFWELGCETKPLPGWFTS